MPPPDQILLHEEGGDPRKGASHTIDFDTPIPVDESELPVTLPETDDFQPGSDPQGVLARLLVGARFRHLRLETRVGRRVGARQRVGRGPEFFDRI